jgi:DNA-binding NarL/FixJ family response regulator
VSADRIRVAIADDNLYTRLGVVTYLRAQPDIEIVGEADDGPAAVALFAAQHPDVFVVDLRMPGLDGVQVTTAVCRDPQARVLLLTHYDGDAHVTQALRAGARGYLTKEARGEELLAAIRAVARGERYLPPPILERMVSAMNQPALTARERTVLEHVARGLSNREIARAMGVAERTVGVYVSVILSKLGARSRTEAVVIATERGLLVRPGP